MPNKAKMLKNILNEPIDIMPKEAKIGLLASKIVLDHFQIDHILDIIFNFEKFNIMLN